MLMFGREVRLPAQLLFNQPTSTDDILSYSEYVDSLTEKMEKAHALVREHLGEFAKWKKAMIANVSYCTNSISTKI